jgi:hypothetical protein
MVRIRNIKPEIPPKPHQQLKEGIPHRPRTDVRSPRLCHAVQVANRQWQRHPHLGRQQEHDPAITAHPEDQPACRSIQKDASQYDHQGDHRKL